MMHSMMKLTEFHTLVQMNYCCCCFLKSGALWHHFKLDFNEYKLFYGAYHWHYGHDDMENTSRFEVL